MASGAQSAASPTGTFAMGERGSAAMARSSRTRRHAVNRPKTLPRTKGSRCLKRQNKGRSEKTRPTAAEQTKNQRQKRAVAIVVGIKKEEETKNRDIFQLSISAVEPRCSGRSLILQCPNYFYMLQKHAHASSAHPALVCWPSEASQTNSKPPPGRGRLPQALGLYICRGEGSGVTADTLATGTSESSYSSY